MRNIRNRYDELDTMTINHMVLGYLNKGLSLSCFKDKSVIDIMQTDYIQCFQTVRYMYHNLPKYLRIYLDVQHNWYEVGEYLWLCRNHEIQDSLLIAMYECINGRYPKQHFVKRKGMLHIISYDGIHVEDKETMTKGVKKKEKVEL